MAEYAAIHEIELQSPEDKGKDKNQGNETARDDAPITRRDAFHEAHAVKRKEKRDGAQDEKQ